MVTTKFMFKCDVCDREYQHGPHRYEGHKLQLYGGAFCCASCWQMNWDGWTPHLEPRLMEILAKAELPVPARNTKGWLPRD